MSQARLGGYNCLSFFAERNDADCTAHINLAARHFSAWGLGLSLGEATIYATVG